MVCRHGWRKPLLLLAGVDSTTCGGCRTPLWPNRHRSTACGGRLFLGGVLGTTLRWRGRGVFRARRKTGGQRALSALMSNVATATLCRADPGTAGLEGGGGVGMLAYAGTRVTSYYAYQVPPGGGHRHSAAAVWSLGHRGSFVSAELGAHWAGSVHGTLFAEPSRGRRYGAYLLSRPFHRINKEVPRQHTSTIARRCRNEIMIRLPLEITLFILREGGMNTGLPFN